MTEKPADKPSRKARCPACGKLRVQAWRPFCSKRCADLDLGRWLGGSYSVAGEPAPLGDEAEEED